MPREIVIKRSTLMTGLLALIGLGIFIIVQNLPEIRREINIWRM